MFMKDAAFLEQLQQELPRRSLSPKATQRFEDTYKMLGVQQEAPVKKRRHKGPVLRHALWGERRVPGLRRGAAGGGAVF